MFIDTILPIFLIVLFPFTIAVFGISIYARTKVDSEFDVHEELYSPKPFSLSEHYERLIQVSEEIAEKKANQKYEPIVLWLLLDGMQINEDGTVKWIKKPSRTNKVVEEVKKEEKERENHEQLIDKYISTKYSQFAIPINEDGTVLYADNKPILSMAGVENCSVEDQLRMQYAQLQYNLASQMANLQNQMQSQELITALMAGARNY